MKTSTWEWECQERGGERRGEGVRGRSEVPFKGLKERYLGMYQVMGRLLIVDLAANQTARPTVTSAISPFSSAELSPDLFPLPGKWPKRQER